MTSKVATACNNCLFIPTLLWFSAFRVVFAQLFLRLFGRLFSNNNPKYTKFQNVFVSFALPPFILCLLLHAAAIAKKFDSAWCFTVHSVYCVLSD